MKIYPYVLLLAACFASAGEVTPEMREILGIKTAALEKYQLQPQISTSGAVLSPAPLLELYRQIESARVAADFSQKNLIRAEALFASGELVAGKDVQAARALQAQDAAKITGLEDRVILEWGTHFSKLDAAARAELVAKILLGHVSIIRLSLPQSAVLDAEPLAARLHRLGQEKTAFTCRLILRAPSADPAFQAQAFLTIYETENAALVPGIALAGVLELGGPAPAGWRVPEAAVLSYLGKNWIYQNTSQDNFERVEISTNQPIEGGFFVAKEGLAEGEVVIVGAQALLSQECSSPDPEE